MKNLFLLFIFTIALNACDKDDDKPVNPVDQLPPATQIGADTAGCLVNGEVLVPFGNITGGNPNIFYIDGLNFGLSFGEKKNGIINFSIGIGSLNRELGEGSIIPLKLNLNSNSLTNAFANYVNFSNTLGGDFNTNDLIIGELKITHHDFDHAILAGTFWFDAINSNGEKVEIREGRFDMHY